MYRNTCLLYNRVNEVYDKLLLFCTEKGFTAGKSQEEFYFFRAKKNLYSFGEL